MGLRVPAPLVALVWLLANRLPCLYRLLYFTGFFWESNEIPRESDSCGRKSSQMIKNTWILMPGLDLISLGFCFLICRMKVGIPAVCIFRSCCMCCPRLYVNTRFSSASSVEISDLLDEIHLLLSSPWVTRCIHTQNDRLGLVVWSVRVKLSEKNHKRPQICGPDFINQAQYSSVWSIFSQMQPSALLPA